MHPTREILPRAAFGCSVVVLGFAYGYLSREHGWFPHGLIEQASQGLKEAREDVHETRPWYYYDTTATRRCTVADRDAVAPGLTLVTGVGADKKQFADVVDVDGNVVQRWALDWFTIWPDATHLPDDIVPKSPPGTMVNGALVTERGDLIFNFDACGLVCLDACGHVRWRRPLRTHHTLWRDDQGHIWTSIRHTRRAARPDLPNYLPNFEEYTIVELSPDGEVLREVPLFGLLQKNDLEGLLYLSAHLDNDTQVSGDTLHVNDVEVFPARLRPGFFQPGDVMVSMRSISTVAVFDPSLRHVKYISTGHFVRQHDPDFIDGNTISVFDNHNVGRVEDGVQSRIVVESIPDGKRRIAFMGTKELPFFSFIIGRHQWLENGNLLLVESTGGRVLEVDAHGRLLWQYVNLTAPHEAGLVSDGMRLPVTMDAAFFDRCRRACDHAPGKL